MKSVRLLLVALFGVMLASCSTPAKVTPKPDVQPVVISNEKTIGKIKDTSADIAETRKKIKSTREDISKSGQSVKEAHETQDKGLQTLEQVMADLNKVLKR